MTARKPMLWIFFGVLTGINIIIYFNREYFSFRPLQTSAGLYSTCNKYCGDKWDAFSDDYSATELAESKYLLDSLSFPAGKETKEQIKWIGAFLYNRFKKQTGTPSLRLSSASPYMQFRLLEKNDTNKLWCGNYAFMFSWFCRSYGITSRIIEIQRAGDHHVVNECYLPAEQQWVLADVTNNLLLPSSREGKLLNTVSFRELINTDSSFNAYTAGNDTTGIAAFNSASFTGEKYYSSSYPLYYYSRVNSDKIYMPKEKIKRYLLPVSWYEVYDPSASTYFQLPYLLKLLFLITWLVVSVLLFKKPIRLLQKKSRKQLRPL